MRYVCRVGGRLIGKERHGMAERRTKHRVTVAAATRRAGQVDDERVADDTCDAARQESMRRLRDRVSAERLGNARRLALQHRARRLGCHVARSEARPARRQDDSGRRGKLFDRSGDLVGLVGNDAPLDVVSVRAQQLVEHVAARVVGRAARDAVRNGQDRRVHSFTFSTSSTENVICLSIAFAMS